MAHELRIFDNTGQTVTAKVYNVATGSHSTVSLTETDTGYYVGTFPSVAAGTWDVSYLSGTNQIGAETIEWDGTQVITIDDIQTEVAAISNGGISVTVVSPVDTTGKISIIRGDDYLVADGRDIRITFSGVPDLTGGTVILSITHGCWRPVSIAGVVTSPASNPTISFELPSEITADMPYQYWDYAVIATLANTDRVTLQTGEVIVND